MFSNKRLPTRRFTLQQRICQHVWGRCFLVLAIPAKVCLACLLLHIRRYKQQYFLMLYSSPTSNAVALLQAAPLTHLSKAFFTTICNFLSFALTEAWPLTFTGPDFWHTDFFLLHQISARGLASSTILRLACKRYALLSNLHSFLGLAAWLGSSISELLALWALKEKQLLTNILEIWVANSA